MAAWVGTAAATVLVAMIALFGTWLTVSTARQAARRAQYDADKQSDRQAKLDAEDRVDELQRRNVRWYNYAIRLRNALFKLGAIPEEIPDDLFDKDS